MEIKVGSGKAKELLHCIWYVSNDQYKGAEGAHQLQQLREKGWIDLGHWHRAPKDWDKKDPFAK